MKIIVHLNHLEINEFPVFLRCINEVARDFVHHFSVTEKRERFLLRHIDEGIFHPFHLRFGSGSDGDIHPTTETGEQDCNYADGETNASHPHPGHSHGNEL